MMDAALHNVLVHLLISNVAHLLLQIVLLKVLVLFLAVFLVLDVLIILLIVQLIQDGTLVVIYVKYKSKLLKTHNAALLQIKCAQQTQDVLHTLVTLQLEIAILHHYVYLILPTNV
jgi:hypothetical protein